MNVILWIRDTFLHSGLTELHMFFITRSTTFFSSSVFVISRLVFFLIRRQSSEVVLWRSKEVSLQLFWKCGVLQSFSRSLAKIYRTAILTNFFLCMWSKSQWSTQLMVFFNPLMLMVTKGHTHLNKPAIFRWRFA